MTTPRTIIALTLLFTLTLPLSAHALWDEAELRAMVAAAEKEVAATPAWQQADSDTRKRLTELAVRRKIVTTAQSGFDAVQMQVDRKIDELLEISLSKTSDLLVNKAAKQGIREMFKEEMFKYMCDKGSTVFESTYDKVRGSGARPEFLMGQGLVGNKIFEKQIGDVLENVNERMGGVVRSTGIIDLKKEIFKQFNMLH